MNIDVDKIIRGLGDVKSLECNRRGSYTCHIGFNGTLGQGWVSPYAKYDEYAGMLGLLKPGIFRTMSPDL